MKSNLKVLSVFSYLRAVNENFITAGDQVIALDIHKLLLDRNIVSYVSGANGTSVTNSINYSYNPVLDRLTNKRRPKFKKSDIPFIECDIVILHGHQLDMLKSYLSVYPDKLFLLFFHAKLDYFGVDKYLIKLNELKKCFNIKTICVSDALRKQIEKKKFKIDFVLPNFIIDVENSNNILKTNKILCVSRNFKDKNLEIFKDIVSNLPSFEFKLIIDNFNGIDISKNLELKLFCKKEELYREIQSCKALLIVNPFESFSNVGFEAQKLKIPVIYLDKNNSSGCSEYVSDEISGFKIDIYKKNKKSINNLLINCFNKLSTHSFNFQHLESLNKNTYYNNLIKIIYDNITRK
jgi:glycosyltransferase involved in cell wall biosynthesis